MEVDTVVADVSRLDDNERAAAYVWGKTGGDLAFLFLNAGTTTLAFGLEALWTTRPEDYRRVLSVDLDGVWFGIRSFVPRMIAAGKEGLVLSTASVAGLMNTSSFTPVMILQRTFLDWTPCSSQLCTGFSFRVLLCHSMTGISRTKSPSTASCS